MAESDNWKVQHSIKFGADMLNLRADSIAELLEMQTEAIDVNGMIIAEAGNSLRAKANVLTEFPGSEEVPFTPAPPAQAGVKLCAHGVAYTYRSGTSKAGKPYSAWFCDVENDARLPKCKAIWD